MALPVTRAQKERRILRAALEELAGADYGALSIDNVAKRAGVAKTTIYRRWPTKGDLVGSALTALADEIALGPSSGSLRADLIDIGRRFLNLSLSLEGQGLARLGVLRRPEPELASVVARLRARREEKLGQMLAAAVDRGELAANADLSLMLDMLGGLLHLRIFVKGMGVDELEIGRAVDVLLHGVAVPDIATRRSSAGPRSSRRRARQ